MPEDITITVYKWEELDERAKDRARDKIGPWLVEWENDNLNYTFSEYLKERGLPGDKIEWSLGYSQGDGVAFYGDIDVEQALGFMKRKTAYRDLRKFDLYARIDRNTWATHYSHSRTMDVIVGAEFARLEWPYEDIETPERSEALQSLREELEEFVRDVSHELEKIGYDAFEWATADEQIADHCEANGYRFDEIGNLI